MSQSKKKYFTTALALIGFLSLGLSACDPCRQLAEQKCHCRYGEDNERRKCISDQKLARQHAYFDTAKDVKTCQEALKNCSCDQLNNEDDEKCGQYRLRTEKTTGN